MDYAVRLRRQMEVFTIVLCLLYQHLLYIAFSFDSVVLELTIQKLIARLGFVPHRRTQTSLICHLLIINIKTKRSI